MQGIKAAELLGYIYIQEFFLSKSSKYLLSSDILPPYRDFEGTKSSGFILILHSFAIQPLNCTSV